MTVLTHEHATSWLKRWDRQQEHYMPEREDRFNTMIDAIEAQAGRPDPIIIDLGCGPGSLSVRILERFPEATVLGVDADPLLLALGRAAYGDMTGLHFIEADLADSSWITSLGLERPADAAVSTTALHWMSPEQVHGLYGEVFGALRDGGMVLNGDHIYVEETPGLCQLEAALIQAAKRRAHGDNPPEDWSQWWEAIAEDPALGPLRSERDSASHRGSRAKQLSQHEDALRAAGFGEVGTIWQLGDDRVLCGLK